MQRITEKQPDGTYHVGPSHIEQLSDTAFGGEAIERLAAMENALEVVEQQYESVSKKLEELKAKGKIRSATAQQMLAQKLTYSTMLGMMEIKK